MAKFVALFALFALFAFATAVPVEEAKKADLQTAQGIGLGFYGYPYFGLGYGYGLGYGLGYGGLYKGFGFYG